MDGEGNTAWHVLASPRPGDSPRFCNDDRWTAEPVEPSNLPRYLGWITTPSFDLALKNGKTTR